MNLIIFAYLTCENTGEEFLFVSDYHGGADEREFWFDVVFDWDGCDVLAACRDDQF